MVPSLANGWSHHWRRDGPIPLAKLTPGGPIPLAGDTDAVSTRVTLLPTYTDAEARKKGMTLTEAREYGTFHFLHRNSPPIAPVPARRVNGRWVPVQGATTNGRPPSTSDAQILTMLSRQGGSVPSKNKLAKLMGVSAGSLDAPLQRLESNGDIVVTLGPRASRIISLP